MSCSQCIRECRRSSKGFKCILGERKETLQDFYHKPVEVSNFEDLVEFYESYQRDYCKRTEEKFGLAPGTIEQDNFFDWILKAGICPIGAITNQSQEWWSYVSALDGEMGLTLPKSDIDEISNVFFEVVGIIRDERAKAREETNASKNSDNNNGR